MNKHGRHTVKATHSHYIPMWEDFEKNRSTLFDSRGVEMPIGTQLKFWKLDQNGEKIVRFAIVIHSLDPRAFDDSLYWIKPLVSHKRV